MLSSSPARLADDELNICEQGLAWPVRIWRRTWYPRAMPNISSAYLSSCHSIPLCCAVQHHLTMPFRITAGMVLSQSTGHRAVHATAASTRTDLTFVKPEAKVDVIPPVSSSEGAWAIRSFCILKLT